SRHSFWTLLYGATARAAVPNEFNATHQWPMRSTSSMRIAITNPYCWPQVRRGSERFMNELGDYLAEHGHEVTMVSTHTGEAEERVEGRRRSVLMPQRFTRFRNQRWLNPGHAFALQVRDFLRRESFDWVHALSYHDAWGAAL